MPNALERMRIHTTSYSIDANPDKKAPTGTSLTIPDIRVVISSGYTEREAVNRFDGDAPGPPIQPLEDVERQTILQAYARCGYNQVQTAKALGIGVSTPERAPSA